jgi:hypothetical protein
MAYIGQNLDRFSNVEKLDAITPATSTGAGPYNLTKGGVAFTPSSADTMVVSIDGVIQYGNFTVSGSTITFSAALADANTCDFIYHMGTGLLSTPVDNSVSTVKIVDDAVTEAKLNLISTSSVPSLEAKGDGSSQDGYIQLNCSQNSHGVKIQSPAHSAGQSYKLILPTGVGTANQVLATNGNANNQLTWIDAQETKPTVANVSQTITPATATTITITGTNFVSIPHVEFVKTDGAVTVANTVSFSSATSLSVNVTLASGNYYVRIENPDGNAGRSTNNIITASTAPTFSTNAGSLGTFAGGTSGTLATIAASSDSAITFSEVTSNLSGANITLNASTGALETTDFGGSSTTATTYNFTIRATDAEGQTADRAFSLTSSFESTGGAGFN